MLFSVSVFFLMKKKNVCLFWISHVILSLSIYYACLIGKSEILFGRCVYKLLLPYSPQPIYHFGRVFNITLYMPSPKYFIAHNFKIDWDKQLLIKAKLTWKTSYEGQSFLLDNDKPWCSHKKTHRIFTKNSAEYQSEYWYTKIKHQGQHGQNAYTKKPCLYPNN